MTTGIKTIGIKTIGIKTFSAFEGRLWQYINAQNYDSAAQLIMDYCTQKSGGGAPYSAALFNGKSFVENILAVKDDALNHALLYALTNEMTRFSYNVAPQDDAIANVKAIILAAAKGPAAEIPEIARHKFSSQLSVTTLALAISHNYPAEAFLADERFMKELGETCRFTGCAEGIRDMIDEAGSRAARKQAELRGKTRSGRAEAKRDDDQLLSMSRGIFLALKGAVTNPAQQDPNGLVEKILEAAVRFPDPRLGAAILADPITAAAINQSYLAPLTTELIVKTLKTTSAHQSPELLDGLGKAVSVGQSLKPAEQLQFLQDIRAGLDDAETQARILNSKTLAGYNPATLIRFSASMADDENYVPCRKQVEDAFGNQAKILQIAALLKVAYDDRLTADDFYNFRAFYGRINRLDPLDNDKLDSKTIRAILTEINGCITLKPPPQKDTYQGQAAEIAYELIRDNMNAKDVLLILRQSGKTASSCNRAEMHKNFNRAKNLYQPLRKAVGFTWLPARLATQGVEAVLGIVRPAYARKEKWRKHLYSRPFQPELKTI
jgi:hypothetical protein